MKKIFKLLIIVLMFSIINVNAENIDTTRTNNITLKYSYGDTNFSNAKGYLYKIADYNADGTLSYKEEFNNITEDIFKLTTTEINALSVSIDNTITQNEIASSYEGITNAEGITQLTSVSTGIYLLKMDTVTNNDYQYKSIPTLISVPLYDEVNNQYKYDLSIVVKTEAKYIGVETGNGDTTEPPNTVDKIIIYVSIFVISLLAIVGLVFYINKVKKEGKKNEKTNNKNI